MSRIIGRVVVGVTGSPENLHALRHAVELARCYEATLIAVNACKVPRSAANVLRSAFDEGLGGLPKDVSCMLLAAPGRPGPALLAVAERPNDVLVLGARRRRPRLSVPRRGVAAFCVEHACCSVFTVPSPPLAVRRRAVAGLRG